MKISSKIVGLLLCAAPFASQAVAQEAPPPAPIQLGKDGHEYLIGPGDNLQIFVWRNPELSVKVPVRPDGRISTPLVEDIVAVGKTPSDLAREMETRLAEYVRSPQVNVIVESFAGTFDDRIRVVGQAAAPKTVPYRDRMTLLDVVIEVGGLGEFAAGNRAKIVRRVDGKSTEIKVKLGDLVNKGMVKYNMPMQPGDVLIIPETRF